MDRRSFLDTLLWTSIAGAALTAIAPLPSYLVPPRGVLRGRRVSLGRMRDFPPGGSRVVDTGARVVIAVHDGGLRVFDAACTHQDCPVEWQAATRTFVCHCHGAVFDREGVPTSGPAKRPLTPLGFAEENGEIFVE